MVGSVYLETRQVVICIEEPSYTLSLFRGPARERRQFSLPASLFSFLITIGF